jgi:hypothetical protein
MVSEVLVHRGRAGLTEQSGSHHGGQEGKRERVREREGEREKERMPVLVDFLLFPF